MLKITTHRESRTTMLEVEGRLTGPWVAELDRSWRVLAEPDQGRILVDLTGVTFIDEAGKALLTRMWRQGVKLQAAGCLTRCIVEEISRAGSSDSPPPQGKRTR
jgi:anti-anti-sigma regulatory factor